MLMSLHLIGYLGFCHLARIQVYRWTSAQTSQTHFFESVQGPRPKCCQQPLQLKHAAGLTQEATWPRGWPSHWKGTSRLEIIGHTKPRKNPRKSRTRTRLRQKARLQRLDRIIQIPETHENRKLAWTLLCCWTNKFFEQIKAWTYFHEVFFGKSELHFLVALVFILLGLLFNEHLHNQYWVVKWQILHKINNHKSQKTNEEAMKVNYF